MRKKGNHANAFRTKIFNLVTLAGALLLTGAWRSLDAQGAPAGSSTQVSPIVPEDTNTYYRQHLKEGRLWLSIPFGMIDKANKRLTLGRTRPTEPEFWINSKSTLIFEYITVSGKIYKVWAMKPWGDGSYAQVPTDEEGAGFRVYNLEGQLIGEYWAAAHKANQMAREDQAEAWVLGWLGEGHIGFAPEAKAAKHFMMKPRPEEGGFGTDCYLRWSWDGGQTWGSAKTWDGVKPMDGPDYPDDRENVAWKVPMAKLEKATDPWVELVVCKGLKITKKRYRIQDLAKHGKTSLATDAASNPAQVAPKRVQPPRAPIPGR